MSQNGVRVAITGMGAISPLGLDVASTWQSCRDGKSGVGPITQFDSSKVSTHFAAEINGFDAAAHLGHKEARRASRCMQLAIVAARQAVTDSGLDIGPISDDVGVLVGSGVGGLEVLERECLHLHSKGKMWPFTVPTMIADMPAGVIAMDLGARGPNFAAVSACASGANAIGEAAEWIKRGDCTAVIAGGTEAAICAIGVGAFNAMQALSERNDDYEHASRPFDRDRDGFVIGEGAGILLLEDLEHARARGAKIYAELSGYGATADAHHITAPPEDGNGAVRCVQRALKRGGHELSDVGYINAHGTSTQLNDAAETRAIKTVFGDLAKGIPMSSTKSMHGHLLGAAGALEAVITVSAMRDGFVPPTINLENPSEECDLDYVPKVGREANIDVALSTSFGFGGHNACLAFRRLD